jgi:AraC family transcriptional regulator, regulatory protein of adaptative response / methylated-DNA-[protein]-cysteine methyltransferase
MKNLPSKKIMYNAFMNRDTQYEGVFWVGVKTTQIFCRPTCTARKPKKENIEYFGSAEQALLAGFNACKRCRPLDAAAAAPNLIKRLCEVVEKSPNYKITNSELLRMGVEPSTARRQFKRYYGMTFQAYSRSRRLGLAFHEMRQGETVIGSQINNGFESASGFWKAYKQLFGTAPSKTGQVECLLAAWIETPLGAMIAIAGEEGLYLLEFTDRRGLENEILKLRKWTHSIIVPGNNRHLEQIKKELIDYFDNGRTKFSVPVIPKGSAFELSVWSLLRTIPAGEKWSYAEMARRLDKPNAVRAVGNANGKNCLGIIIPCHRVIGSDGNLHGYGGGVWRKKWLLEHEEQV